MTGDSAKPSAGVDQIREFDDPPGARDLWIAYGGDPDEFDRRVEDYLKVAKYV